MAPRAFIGVAATLFLLFSMGVPSVASAQTTVLYLDSQAGDYIGRGQQQTLMFPDLVFSTTVSSDRSTVGIVGHAPGYPSNWHLYFSAPAGTPLSPGIYEDAARYPFQVPTTNGLSVSGDGAGCNIVAGRFQIHEIVVDANGILRQFAADFEQHCEGAAAALFGAVRYLSSRSSLNPFGGDYPLHGLRITPAANGYVVGPGIDCGAGRTDCQELYGADTIVAVQAVPQPGYVFVGWSGYACVGADIVAVRVDWLMNCAPVFNVAPGGSGIEVPDYSSQALILDGDIRIWNVSPVDGHRRMAYVPPHGAVSLAGSSLNEIKVTATGQRGDTWRVSFGAPPNATLAPGEYGPTAESFAARSQEPVLSMQGYVTCSPGGRFTIYELEFSAGAITRFSADFEVPCGSPAKPVAGSVRYGAGRATLLPFDGAYPRHRLNLHASLGGYVTANGISCGDGGRTDCTEDFQTNTLVSLLAHASAGYDFLGWSGRCSGSSAITTLTMDRSQLCLAIFHPSAGSGAPAEASFGLGTLVLDSPGTSEIPSRQIFVSPDAAVSRSGWGSTQDFRFRTTLDDETISFGVPSGRFFAGHYDEVYESPSPWFPHMSIPRCRGGMRSLTVYQADYDGAGALVAFAADFEAYCSSSTRPYVAGALRFNASRTAIRPFDGAYPRYRLAVVSNGYGRVSGPGIDCGAGALDCDEEFVTPTAVVIRATPAAGYRFHGWTGGCEGTAETTVTVTRTRRCEAIFRAATPGSGPQDPRLMSGALLVQSTAGDPVGKGRRDLFLEATISANSLFQRTRLAVQVVYPDGRTWLLDFGMPGGHQLAAGIYLGAGPLSMTGGPSIDIRGFNPWSDCGLKDQVSGRFTIHEIDFASTSSTTLTRLALDFEQRCTPTSPPLVGSVRYNSSHAEPRPFVGIEGSFVPFDLSADGAADLLWQNRADGRLWFWHMSGATHIFDEALAPAEVGDTDWHIVGSADANGDGYADLYWQHQTSGQLSVWYMRENALVSGELLTPGAVPDTNWKVRSIADMDRDGHPDLIWQHIATGHVAVWFMNGRTLRSGDLIGPGPVPDLDWAIAGAGDMNGDGWTDLLWHHAGSGDLAVWFMFGQTMLRGESLAPAAVPDTNWRVRGVADLDRNGTPDLLWQNLSTLDVAVWFMNGLQLIDGRPVIGPRLPSAAWHLVTPR